MAPVSSLPSLLNTKKTVIIGEHWKKECTDRKSCLLPYFAGVQYQTGSRQLTKKKVNKHFFVVSVSLSELASRREKAKTTTNRPSKRSSLVLRCAHKLKHRNQFIGLRHHRSLDENLTSLLLKKVCVQFSSWKELFSSCVWSTSTSTSSHTTTTSGVTQLYTLTVVV